MIGSVSAVAASSSGCHIFSGCGFPSPSLESFDFKPIFSIGSFHFTKPILIVLIVVSSIVAFFWAAFYKPKLVPRGDTEPRRGRPAGRPGPDRPPVAGQAGRHIPAVPGLAVLLHLLLNLMEIIPVFQFPPMSRIGFPWPWC